MRHGIARIVDVCRSSWTLRLLAVILLGVPVGELPVFAADDFEREPVNYSKARRRTSSRDCRNRLQSGRVRFDFDERWGYLRSLLRALNVPESSQMLVFSKTSFQRQRIAPRTPRALYFNDDVYVGYCCRRRRDGNLGGRSQCWERCSTRSTRSASTSRASRGKPIPACCAMRTRRRRASRVSSIRSVYADAAGFPMLGSGTFHIDQTSPLKNRWGGWYVTGTHGKQKHLGNLIVTDKQTPEETDNSAGMNVTSLAGRFERHRNIWPARATSWR